ncbi:MAG: RNA polymerase sigma factor [Desulfatiglandales bacterium]
MNPISDNELMLSVREGAVDKLGLLFERHHVPLYNFFLKLVGNREISEDLVQEVFLRILKHRKTYRGESKFTSWMYQIARNARVDYYRKRKLEVSTDEEKMEPVSQDPMPTDDLETGQETALLRAALNRLPFKKREVLVLSRFHDMKYEEIAKVLNCPVSTVKVLVHRAIKDLRSIFYELSGEKAI